MRQNMPMQQKPTREFIVIAGNGHHVRGWKTKDAGTARTAVLLCPELGAIPEAWPRSLATRTDLSTVSWYQRGSTSVTLDEHIEDALAVLDAAGVHRCAVVGWSVGSAVAVGLATRAPDLVRGVMLLGGAPGGRLHNLLDALGVPVPLRRLFATGSVRSLQLAGPVLEGAVRRLPVSERSARLLQLAGLAVPQGDPAAIGAALRRFLRHEWLWYTTLALALGGAHAPVGTIACPLTILVGRHDLLTDVPSIVQPVAALPQARVRILPASHLVPLEAPDEVDRELRLLLDRIDTVEYARRGEEPPSPWPVQSLPAVPLVGG
jgi:pimeloyl-ACP methyl ester carboxylesterase